MRSLFFILIFLISSAAFALGVSAVRKDGESFDQAHMRTLIEHRLFAGFPIDFTQDTLTRRTPIDEKVDLRNLDLRTIAELPSYEVLEKEFAYIRDTRFLESPDADFPRRLTWLFPDDGCYARAEMAKIKLVEHQQIAPNKIFVFGSLSASTKNTFSGRVTWWYHVAATYRVGEAVYVFDPSIEPLHPLTLDQWNLAVGGTQTAVQYAICAPNAFDPNSNCAQPKETSLEIVLLNQNKFLSPEWSRLKSLRRDPVKELGDFPPWLN